MIIVICLPLKTILDQEGLRGYNEFYDGTRPRIRRGWIAEVPENSGVKVYGTSREDAINKVQALAFRVLAERLEHGEGTPGNLMGIAFVAAA